MIKSPINYTGNKFKLLKDLLPLFPTEIETFVDVFTGSGTVFANVQANKILANDCYSQLIDLHEYLYRTELDCVFKDIEIGLSSFNLNNLNKDSYYKLREFYNENADPRALFLLICHSFNNQIRFNSKGKFNLPFGNRSYNKSIESNLLKYKTEIDKKEISFFNLDFMQFISYVKENCDPKTTFLYFDPPYLITDATYNVFWDSAKEVELYYQLMSLTELGYKWGLSNVIEHKGKENVILKEWLDRVIVQCYYPNYSYSNCNYQTSGKSVEIYVTNYAKNFKELMNE